MKKQKRKRKSSKPVKPRGPSKLQIIFRNQWKWAVSEYGLFLPSYDLVEEYRFSSVRKSRLDFAIPEIKFGIEIQGGISSKIMGHTSFSGFTIDCEKLNHLQSLGWTIFKFTGQHVQSRYAINFVINYFISNKDPFFLDPVLFTKFEIEPRPGIPTAYYLGGILEIPGNTNLELPLGLSDHK